VGYISSNSVSSAASTCHEHFSDLDIESSRIPLTRRDTDQQFDRPFPTRTSTDLPAIKKQTLASSRPSTINCPAVEDVGRDTDLADGNLELELQLQRQNYQGGDGSSRRLSIQSGQSSLCLLVH
jgi:hypothetical protein